MVTDWPEYLADSDKNMQEFFLKSRVGVLLESISAYLPEYSPKDLVVCHRQNAKGAWKCELWTNRRFAPRELAFAPYSSTIMKTHLTMNANCPISLPRVGPGAHPEDAPLALDGRGRLSLGPKDLVDSSEHHGSLFWLVHRSSVPAEANMSLELVTWENNVHMMLDLPVKKQKAHKVEEILDWKGKDLPTVPLLLNTGIIEAHQRLVVYLQGKATDSPQKEPQAVPVGESVNKRPQKGPQAVPVGERVNKGPQKGPQAVSAGESANKGPSA